MSKTVTYYEGVWDCRGLNGCGKTGIPASLKECPVCGDPQNSVLTPEEDWYLPENAQVVTDPEELAWAKAGRAWNCGKCGTLNRGDATECHECHEPLGLNDTVNREVAYDDHADRYDVAPDVDAERIEDDLSIAQRTIDTKASGPRIMDDRVLPGNILPRKGRDTDELNEIRKQVNDDYEERTRIAALSPIMQWYHQHKRATHIGGVAAVLLLIVSLITGGIQWYQYETAAVPGTVTVTELHWERKVEVEKYVTYNKQDWDHPSDARIQSSERRFHYNRTVHDRWETQWWDEPETRYNEVHYTEIESYPRQQPYPSTCSRTRTVSAGNGKFRVENESYSCTKTRTVYDRVEVPKIRREPYVVMVRKPHQVEITHQEAVYDPWYVYQIDRWATERWVTASDANKAQAYWPEVTDLKRNNQPGDEVGEERIGGQENWVQHYQIVYTDSKGVNRTEDSDGDGLWAKLEKGETIAAQYYQKNGELKSVDWKSVA